MKTRIIEPSQNAYSYPLLIKSLLLSGERYEPDHEIVYSDLIRYDYVTLNQRIRKLANVLTEAGVGAGDTVAVMDWDSHRYLEAYFAIPMIGAIIHHVNVRLSPDQIAYTMNHAEDDYLMVHDDFLALAEGISERTPTVKGVIQLTDEAQATPSSLNLIGEYETLLSNASDQYDFPDFDENSVATTFYTTGTTGNPKGVCFSHRQLVLHTLNMASMLGVYEGQPLLRSEDVYMPMTPMFHVHAWGVPYAATMIGVKQVYPGRYEPNKMVKLYRDEGVTFSHGVPAVLQMILSCDEAKNTDLNGWKMLTGGSAPTAGLASEMADRGVQFFTAYGMSETCPLLTLVHLHESERELPLQEQVPARTKTGVPVSMVDLRIVDPQGNVVPHDGESVGEIVVRAPWLTQSYHKESEKSDELWAGGWLHTGDVASIDQNNSVQIKDRIKDVIKTGGEWISSLELESLISEQGHIAEVAVVGIPDERWDERPYALVVPVPGEEVTAEQITQHLQQYVEQGRINRWAIPQQIEITTEIPKTSVGKINKKQIRLNLG
ncbi:fatty acid--CoA ligase [Amphritea balenae]|uniref:Fatty acid--CoA ligase n=1 Tax=Amphritea balenae TaxID=452629 RepID=A0A3P1SVA2_9GAMM|nr:fatty acid--CoA ligase [Amphritea balenae]RRD01040.1 fatty acid--CoA ligase [Amphritea balenae]GGK60483.1 long-chain-fatty-acid--CoA ligase [Amphritea balenae]